MLSKSHTDLASRLYLSQGLDIWVQDSDGGCASVPGILFPFWHDKDDPPAWVWGTQSTMMFRRALLALILPASPGDGETFRICADFYLVQFGQLIGGSFVFREALGCYRRHGGNNFSRNGIIAARMQTGDMRSHPSVAGYKQLALQVLAERKDDFLSVLGTTRYYDLAAHVGSLSNYRVGPKPLHRRFVRGALARLIGEDAYVRLRLSLGRLIG